VLVEQLAELERFPDGNAHLATEENWSVLGDAVSAAPDQQQVFR
jgi:hypothetical protein